MQMLSDSEARKDTVCMDGYWFSNWSAIGGLMVGLFPLKALMTLLV